MTTEVLGHGCVGAWVCVGVSVCAYMYVLRYGHETRLRSIYDICGA